MPTARLLGVALLINLALCLLVAASGALFTLDAVGTALAALLAGPWWGAAVALVSTSIARFVLTPWHSTAASACQLWPVGVAAGLFWGWLSRSRWRLFERRIQGRVLLRRLLGLGLGGGLLISAVELVVRSSTEPWTSNAAEIAIRTPDRFLSLATALLLAYYLAPNLRSTLEGGPVPAKPRYRLNVLSLYRTVTLFVVAVCMVLINIVDPRIFAAPHLDDPSMAGRLTATFGLLLLPYASVRLWLKLSPHGHRKSHRRKRRRQGVHQHGDRANSSGPQKTSTLN